MTKRELEQKFKKAGWSFIQGANHEKAVSPDGKKKFLFHGTRATFQKERLLQY